MSKKGILIVLSGPSGVGKDTVLNEFLEQNSSLANCAVSISATTRSPREGERDGEHYYFLTEKEFTERIAKGQMLEFAKYNGNYYGTPKNMVEEKLNEGKHVILVIETKGAQQIRNSRPDSLFVFLMPPTPEDLRKRLTKRGTEDQDAIEGRLSASIEEMKLATTYDFVLVNCDLQNTVRDFKTIISAAEHSPKYVPDLLKGVYNHNA